MVAGRYTVLQELGSGSTSTTYKARAPDGSIVALKAMSFRSMTDWKQLELFEREASILQSLSHPGIPAHIDSFQVDTDNDRAYVLVQVGIKSDQDRHCYPQRVTAAVDCIFCDWLRSRPTHCYGILGIWLKPSNP